MVAKHDQTDRFELVASDVPRQARLALGKKGVVEIALDRLPRHLLGGEDGLVMNGLRRLLADTLAGEPDTRSAQETVEAWYSGYRNRRSAGMPDALGRGATPKSVAAARVTQAVADGMLQDLAARRTGDEKMRTTSRRELRRKLGDVRPTEKSAEGDAFPPETPPLR